MVNMGDALMGTGIATGEERAILAAQEAINSPLLQDTSIKGAKNLLLHIAGPSDMKMSEMVSASNIIYEEAGEDVNVIFGCVTDERLNENQEIHVTVVATGINSDSDLAKDSSTVYNIHNKTTDYFDSKNKSHESDNVINQEDNSQLSINTEEVEPDNINLTFGEDDLEVPAYLRKGN